MTFTLVVFLSACAVTVFFGYKMIVEIYNRIEYLEKKLESQEKDHE